ncbi:hypothetical protein I4U23_012183 [Adineta vaga]|nr:hypothetical protein I4U23_012183 [Adineta vaga]
MSMDDLLMFFSFVHLPVLEKLILINIHDDSLIRLNDFQTYFQSKENLSAPRPSSFRFLLRFPGVLENMNGINIIIHNGHLILLTSIIVLTLPMPKKYSLLIFTPTKLKQTPSTFIEFSRARQLIRLTTNWNYIMNIDSNCAGQYYVPPILNLRHLYLRNTKRGELMNLLELIDSPLLSTLFPQITIFMGQVDVIYL